ncbi:restriction endonuclease subunit S [Vibrio cholerae]
MKLKQIATINAGYPFRGKIPEVPGSAMVAVQMKDVSLTEGIRWPDCLETELTGKREPDYLTTGDILVAARGSHNYAVQVDQALATIGKQAVAAPHFFVISLKKKDILPEFLVWLLNQTPTQRYFEQNAEGTLTKSIRRSVLEEAPVVVPPLAKQRAIISMAATLRDEHKLIQKLVSNGERMMNAIAKDLFENKEVIK